MSVQLTQPAPQPGEERSREAINRNLRQIHLLLKRTARLSKQQGWIFEEYKADKLKEQVVEWRANREMHEKVFIPGIGGHDEIRDRLQQVKLAPFTRAYMRKEFKRLGIIQEGL